MTLRFALAGAVAVCVCASAAVGAARVVPARVQVAATEYNFALSRLKIKSGPAIIQLANFGEDPHDLRLKRVGGTRTYGLPVTAPGDDRDLSVKLLPGRYTLWCSIADHRKRGMVAALTVVPAPRKV